MQPWMILALLIGAGFVTLLIAPTIHRRINAKSRGEVARSRAERARQRLSDGAASREFPDAATCVRIRDRLLIRGVRAEVLEESGTWLVLFDTEDAEKVDQAIAELDME